MPLTCSVALRRRAASRLPSFLLVAEHRIQIAHGLFLGLDALQFDEHCLDGLHHARNGHLAQRQHLVVVADGRGADEGERALQPIIVFLRVDPASTVFTLVMTLSMRRMARALSKRTLRSLHLNWTS